MTHQPIPTLHLFDKVDALLIAALDGLPGEEWLRPTLAGQWRVRDVAAHLLDGYLRTLSLYRDGYALPPDAPIHGYADIVAFLNRMNASFVSVAERFSPELLVAALRWAGPHSTAELKALDLQADAVYSVAWAGQSVSPNWFHIAREYTERVHHQLQIREALGQTAPLMEAELFRPFIHTLLYGLIPVYQQSGAPDGTTVAIRIAGSGDGVWHLRNGEGIWSITEGWPEAGAEASLTLPADAAWKVLTKGIRPEAAARFAEWTGDPSLALRALHAVSVMG